MTRTRPFFADVVLRVFAEAGRRGRAAEILARTGKAKFFRAHPDADIPSLVGARIAPARPRRPASVNAPAVLMAAIMFLSGPVWAEDFEFFEKKIRPVLVERCYKCHSAQSEKLKGGLSLDSRAGMLQGGESSQPAIVPGQPAQSRLIEAIRYQNNDLQMPPPKQGQLTESQVADFVAWVAAGAPDPRTDNVPSAVPKLTPPVSRFTNHWSFLPPRAGPIPKVRNEQWPSTPIDFFILSKLEANRLSPAPPADRRTLIRRATFDLTGLPPTATEVEDFLRDESPGAFAKVVDRLLATPQYGERWGRYWLDVARYADTKGYVYGDREEARFVHSYAYRDWVIRAFNDDLPYNQFLVRQIAADQLTAADTEPGPPDDSLAAMGFLTLGRRFLGVVHDIIDDRIDVLMRGTQGLTVGCARCHDHKFDPIPTRDYYSLYGVFAACTEKMLPLNQPSPRGNAQVDYEKGLQERVNKYQQTLQKRREEFSNRFRSKSAEYLVAVLDVKKLPTEEHYEIRGPDDLNPTVVRSWENYLLQTKAGFHPVFGPWHALSALEPKVFKTQAAALVRQWAANNPASRPVNAALMESLSETPLESMRQVAERYGKLLAQAHQQWQGLVQTAVTNKTELPVSLADAAREELRQVLYGSNAPVNIPMLAAADMEWYFDEPTRVEFMKLHAEIERWIIKSPGAPPHAVILEDRPNPKNPRVFVRGNPANQGDEVPRQYLEVLAPGKRKPFQKGSGRLELAQAIASKENPLTARVMVNRIWLHHFGAGLVRTPSDFGTRCEPPSHPELLDWLAVQFMKDDWSIKKLHRMIMLSSTYQQASGAAVPAQSQFEKSALGSAGYPPAWPKPLRRGEGPPVPSGNLPDGTGVASMPNPGAGLVANTAAIPVGRLLAGAGRLPAPPVFQTGSKSMEAPSATPAGPPPSAATIDPENRLLWRMNRSRLDFETLHDVLLAVSGELNSRMAGSPADLFKAPFSPRRAIYGFIDRQFLPGVFRVFDFANPDLHNPQRPETTVPQQALFFMNSPFAVERARALVNRSDVQSATDDEQRLQQLYRIVYQRAATPTQVALGRNFIRAAEADPPFEPPPPPVSAWQYGFGEFDGAAKRVKNFTALPHFSGDAWQGGSNWPDEKFGWVRLTADGGHAGNDLQHAAIRRWIAPLEGTIAIQGTIQHSHEAGDGVRARIVSSRHGSLGDWTIHKGKAETKAESVAVQKGDTLDFLVDFNANLNSDDFAWSPVIKVVSPAGPAASGVNPKEWNAKKEFSGPPVPPPRPLNAWEKYAQVLLLSNEFLFVD